MKLYRHCRHQLIRAKRENMYTPIGKKAQSVIEYALLLALVGAALVTMQVYMKRGIQGAVKGAADQLGPQQYQFQQANPNGAPIFFRNGQTESIGNSTSQGTIRTIVSNGGSQTRIVDTNETIASSSSSNTTETGN